MSNSFTKNQEVMQISDVLLSQESDVLELDNKKFMSKKELKKLQEKERKNKEKKENELLCSKIKNETLSDDFAEENYGKKKMNQSFEKSGKQFHPICNLSELMDGKDVVLRARLQTSRLQEGNKMCFLLLRQHLSTVQALVIADEKLISRKMVKWCGSISPESIVLVEGQIKKSPGIITSSTQQDVEVHIHKIFIESESSNKLPFQIEDANRPENEIKHDEDYSKDEPKFARVNLDTRLSNRIIDLRTFASQAIFRISSGICQLFREYFVENNFIEIHTPKIISFPSEGGSNVFRLEYFKGNAYLAQSPQIYKQMLIVSDFDRVFEIAPVFRAEDSNTHRHMTEFTGIDLEMSFCEHYHEVLEMIEGLFIYIFKEIPKRYSHEMSVIRKQFPISEFQFLKDDKPVRFTFREIIDLLKKAGIRSDNDEEYYTDLSLSNSYDFFIRGEEVLSGSQRIHDSEYLQERMKTMKINTMGLEDYIDGFKYGAPPHGGGGIGLERVVFLYLGLGNIRRSSLFPRDPKRLNP
ncbi:hypothetical protein PCANB_002205 [Pneumocystis canis]|nr:hypothetical protein PCANB_002205 [Pneumocystis canis]